MLRDEALSLLGSEKASERLAAARALLQQAEGQDLAPLRAALNAEDEWWVRRALARAVMRVALNEQQAARPMSADLDPDLADVRAEAVQEVAGLLLHELHPLIGIVELAASADVESYGGSQTERAIDRVRAFLDALEVLRAAAGVPSGSEVDLTDVIHGIVREEAWAAGAVRLARNDPVIVYGDPGLARMAVVNPLRNAVEATEAIRSSDPEPPVVSWGLTDRDAWITILDEGIGLPEGLERLWVPGVTTKSKESHLGFGLSIAHQAVASLGGSIELAPRDPRGTACEIRWRSETR